MHHYSSLTLISLFLLISCGHHRDVRPGENGLNRVVVRSEDKESGEQDAIAQANHYCEKYSKEAVFIKENSQYSGDVSEETYKTGKVISKAAMMGGAAYGLQEKEDSNIGSMTLLSGSVAKSALGNGYTTEMQFKCQ